MLSEKQKNDPFYVMDENEFQKSTIEHIGEKVITLEGMSGLFGYNKEFKTLIVAKKNYDLGVYAYETLKILSHKYGNVEHILVIALSFNDKFYDRAVADPQLRVMPVTVEYILKYDDRSALTTIMKGTHMRMLFL